jgi:hypothetical protein
MFTHARLLKVVLYKVNGTAFLHARFLALLFNGWYGSVHPFKFDIATQFMLFEPGESEHWLPT